MKKTTIVTRFPPSPTGYFHIGSARTALFNHLFAARRGGAMVLRFEDTDRQRSKREYEQDILDGLAWLGIPYTLAAPPRQSEKLEVYQKHFKRLLEEDLAYEAEESKDAPGMKTVRFRNPGGVVRFEDLIRGTVSFDIGELGDFVIGKSVREPLYNFAVTVDDHDSGVSHVIRGEDHISNTPRQIVMLEALGFSRPKYAHIPLILAPDRSKLSKRHGAVSLNEYRRSGFLPEALVNYLALLGWHPQGDRELFSLAELEKEFSLERVQKGGAVFSIEKLRWFNAEHARKLSPNAYCLRLEAFLREQGDDAPPYLSRIVPLLQERTSTLLEAAQLLKSKEFSFMETRQQSISGVARITKSPEDLLLKNAKADKKVVCLHLQTVIAMLEPLSEFDADSIKNRLMPYANERGRSAVLWPLRVALSGQEKSPDPFTIAALLGKDETLVRIQAALDALAS